MRLRLVIIAIHLLSSVAAAKEAQRLHMAAVKLVRALEKTICSDLRSADKNCKIAVESVTHHELGNGRALWAYAWRADAAFRKKGEDEFVMRDALEKLQVQVLDIFSNYFTGVAYFQGHPNGLEQISGSAFSMVALNTTHKAVARISPELLLHGDMTYTLPEKWQIDGLRTSDSGEITLSLYTPQSGLIFQLLDLDDAPLRGVRISSCSFSTGTKSGNCGAGVILPENDRVRVTLSIVSEKKIRTSQPAFKLVAQESESAGILFHLAIPFKPGPNYFVFGVAGFLFGGLIAVMLMVMRKKPVLPGKAQ